MEKEMKEKLYRQRKELRRIEEKEKSLQNCAYKPRSSYYKQRNIRNRKIDEQVKLESYKREMTQNEELIKHCFVKRNALSKNSAVFKLRSNSWDRL